MLTPNHMLYVNSCIPLAMNFAINKDTCIVQHNTVLTHLINEIII